ncbi:hypothetical protein CP965_11950 [Halarcobacter mediterraneus]|uniref:Uncharacterized protein n=1 Tax=Halarcobacter mediterraneus TaxID=2023153 RepID=A0A4Q1ATT3_9BACT|nr:hypothetical protein [Halarcobacter mediterraneus]RXK11887.1 hypothetical protein CP965_11950 [Halarcobacter mediterraneus]
MIEKIVDEMLTLVKKMKDYINQDIEDIKHARHEALLTRNEEKQEMMEKIVSYKQELNQEIINKMNEGIDVNIYREMVDNLEVELKSLYELNKKLAIIVQPIQQMYKEIVEELTQINGGKMVDVKA